MVDRKRMIRVIRRDEPPPCEVALPFVEHARIAFCETALEPAEGTGVRWRNELFFSVEYRGEAPEELEIIIGNLKGCLALSADLLHWI